MKTLKLGALALGMLAASSAMAMDKTKALGDAKNDLRNNANSKIKKSTRRKSGSDTGVKKQKKTVTPVADINTYNPVGPVASVDDSVLSVPTGKNHTKSTLDKIKAFPKVCLRNIKLHPWMSGMGAAVVVIIGAAVYVMNKKVAQDADVRSNDEDDIEQDMMIVE